MAVILEDVHVRPGAGIAENSRVNVRLSGGACSVERIANAVKSSEIIWEKGWWKFHRPFVVII